MKCSNCKYFVATDEKFGKCDNPKLRYGYDSDEIEDDYLIYEDYEEYNAYLYVGRNFGCIHYQVD